jgi:hypothetical protein
MKQYPPEFRSERLAWRFRKSGADGQYAKQFASFDEKARRDLVQLAEIREGESPVVACYFDDTMWALITNERLIWANDGRRTALKLDEIEDATVEPQSLFQGGTKQNLTELTVVAKDGQRYHVQIEAGQPFSGFWNALKMVASWNK